MMEHRPYPDLPSRIGERNGDPLAERTIGLAGDEPGALDKGLREEGMIGRGLRVMIDCSEMAALQEVKRKRDTAVRACWPLCRR